jgi:hypothetical protein
MRQAISKTTKDSDDRNVLEFHLGVRVYPPARGGGYWRIRWEERRQPKDTSAKDQAAAIKKAQDIVERLRPSAPTELAERRAHIWSPTTSTRPGGRHGWRSGR